MTLLVDDLITDFRSDVFDRSVDEDGALRSTLWSKEEVLRYLNDAVAQWAADTLAYRRIMEFDLVEGESTYRLPYEVIELVTAVHRLPGGGRVRPLWVYNQDDGYIQDDYGQIIYSLTDLDSRQGLPRGLSFDIVPYHARVYPVPDSAGVGTVTINAAVYPAPLYAGMPLPSNNRQDRHLWLLWMKKLAYAKQDADTLDLSRSKEFENEYSSLMPRRLYSHDRATRRGGVVRSRW